MRDFRDAVRALHANPLVTLVAILSLAFGIGANTAIFSLINSLLLRSLPVREPQRLVVINRVLTNPIWEQIRDHGDFLEAVTAWGSARFNLAQGGPADPVTGFWVSGSFLQTLGVSPMLGRGLTPADDRRGGGPDGPVAMISYGFWQRKFGGAGDVIGRPLTMSNVTYTIVGVTPSSFFGPDVGRRFDVLVPIGTEPILRGPESFLDRRSTWWLTVMGRLQPGQSVAAARSALSVLIPQIRDATMPPNYGSEAQARYLKDGFAVTPAATGASFLRSTYRQPLTALMAVVGLVLLIACANIANLQLARATARRHELSVRQAIGASRWALVRQVLAESVLLSGAGAFLGLFFALWGSRLLARQLSTQANAAFLDLSLDWRVLAFTAAVAVLTAVAFGTAPAFRASRVEPIEAMKEQGRGTSARGGRLAGVLVVAQVALSLVLVVAAGLFVRTFGTLARMNPGFDKERLLAVSLNTQQAGVKPEDRAELFDRIRRATLQAPGVATAAVAVVVPVSGMTWNSDFDLVGEPGPTGDDRLANVNLISPGWFGTYGTALVAGRDLDERDRTGAEPVAIVNQAFERRFFQGGSALEHRIKQEGIPGLARPAMRVVGVARDAVYLSLRDTIPPTVYLPMAQSDGPLTFASLTVRASGGAPGLLTRTVTQVVEGIDPQISLSFSVLADQINDSMNQERLVAMLSGFFGALALLLAGLGLYGITSYSVTRRRTELGIYLALGSSPAGLVKQVLRRVALLIGSGVGIGLVASWWLVRFAGSLLYGLGPHDAATFGAAAAVLAVVGALAGWVPARRAAAVDPAEVLREG
ncbi:MAG: ABC transporter permease [Gemmatimonadetes bacterium]|nr:ABC transporter permease [Gemmatimonadota bacterium]